MPLYYAGSELSNKDRNFLNIAIKWAMTSNERMKHGALIVKGGSIISTGVNKRKNHPTVVEADINPSLCGPHAEMDAIKKVVRRNPAALKGAVLYVARVNSAGHPRMSKPCSRCQQEIDNSGIKRVVWTV